MRDEIVERVELMIPDADEDVLEMLADDCMDEFRAACCRDDVPESARPIIVQMVLMRYNQQGAEGLASQSYSGQSESYLTDWPDTVKRGIQRFRKARFL